MPQKFLVCQLQVTEVQLWIDTYNSQRPKANQTKPAESANVADKQERHSDAVSFSEDLESYHVLEYDENKIPGPYAHDQPNERHEEVPVCERPSKVRVLVPAELEHIIYEDSAIDDDDSSQSSLPAIATLDDDDDDDDVDESQSKAGGVECPNATGTTDQETWTNMPWNCIECNEQTNNVQDLRAHFDGCHPRKSLRYSCTDCPRIFGRYNGYLKHIRTGHKPHLKFW